VVQWSGLAFSATFISAGLIAPVWGTLGDRYGRKSMLVRASLGMAVTVSLLGLVTNIGPLVGLRVFGGLAGGYSSGASIL
ncbi:MFS transporter, partial [Salmonella enterica subsp. enterica serovar Infantis]